MNKYLFVILSVFIVVGSSKAAKFSGDAFSLGAGARPMAMGGATIAGPFDPSTLYWNPAGMNYLSGKHLIAMHAETFGSLLNHDYLSYINAVKKENSIFQSFGFYLYYLGGGGIKITALDNNNRPYVVKEESHGDYLLAASLSGRLKDKFDFGLTAKIIYRDLGTESGQGLTVDAGLLYQFSTELRLGLMVSDITTGFIRYSGKTFDDGSNFETIYPTLKPGITYKRKFNKFTALFAVSGDINFENLKESAQYWSGSLSMDSHFGWEAGYNDMVFARAGFDIGRFTAGGGFKVKNGAIDFAFLNHDELDQTFRISASYNW